jgi:hypothetical protein
MMVAASVATFWVCWRVEPGAISTATEVKSLLTFGWKVKGKVLKAKMVAMKAATPISIVFQRCLSDHQSRPM